MILKIKELILVSIILLALISFGAVSAAENTIAEETAVEESEAYLTSSENDGRTTNRNASKQEEVTFSQNKNDNKLGANNEELLSEPVEPTYTYDFDLPMSGTAYVAQWGQPITVSAKYGNATGNVTITFDSKTYNTKLVDGGFTYTVTKYSSVRNNQAFKVVYEGDENYKSVTFQKNIHIQINGVVANGANYGQQAFVDVNLYNATGNVTFTLNGKTYRKELDNGKTIQEFTHYNLGRNTVSFAYEGDENYEPITRSLTFNTAANIDAPTIYNAQPAIITLNLGEATGNVTLNFNGNATTIGLNNGVAIYEAKNYAMGSNTISVAYSGDDDFDPFTTTKTFNVLDKENSTILASVYKTANKKMIVICIPHGSGNVTALINGKKEILELNNGIVMHNIDFDTVITELNVTYDGNGRLNPANSSYFLNLNNTVTNENYMYYFNQGNGGKIFDFIENGTTLDFQGKIINPDQSKNVYFDVNKPINIISTTGDAYIDLNTTAGSLLGENPGNRFTISYGGSWTNMTGITFHNTQLWLFNTHHVVLDRVNNIIEDQRVGSGVGATSVRQNSTWVTIKNGYFYTRNNGGSSSLVIAWADYCTFDNNTVVVEGQVGNMIYLTTYNVEIPSNVMPNKYNNITNNRIYGPSTAASICWALVVYGTENLIANNFIDYVGVGLNLQYGSSGILNNTYINNTLIGGASAILPSGSTAYNNYVSGTFTTGTDSMVYNNTVLKAMTVSARATAYNNTVAGFTLSGQDARISENTVNGATTISAINLIISGNTFLGDNTIKFNNANANNITFVENNVIGDIEFANANAKNNRIINNIITTSKEYAINLKTYKGTNNNISGNYIYSANRFGNDAVKHADDDTLILNNYPIQNVEIIVETADIKVGQKAVFTVTVSEKSIVSADIVINNKKHALTLVNGKGSIEIGDLLANTYDVRVYAIDKTFSAQNATTLKVEKNDCPEISVVVPNIVQWIPTAITVSIPNATGTVTLSINGSTANAELINGVAHITLPNLTVGKFNYTISYTGDYRYLGNVTTGSLTVNKNKEVKIIVADVVADKLANKFTAKFTNYIGEAISNANVTIAIDGRIIQGVSDENGIVSIDLALTRGIYNVNITFSAIEGQYDANTAKATIYVTGESALSIISVSGKGMITGFLADDLGNPIANAIISYKMNNLEDNTTTDANGLFVIQAISNCVVEMTYAGNSTLLASNASITLDGVESSAYRTVLTVVSVSGNMITGNLADISGKPIAGATITYKIGSTQGSVTTNAIGTFEIQAEYGSTVEITYTGNTTLLPSNTSITLENPTPTTY